MAPAQWGSLMPTASYTLIFYRCPMQREGWFLAQKKRDVKPIGRAVSQGTCTAELPARTPHQQPVCIPRVWHLPHPLPRQWWGFGHSLLASGLFPALWKGGKITEQSRASFCLPPPASLSHRWRVRGDTPSPAPRRSADCAGTREAAPYKQVMLVFFALQRDPHKVAQSTLSTSLFQAHVVLQVTESVPVCQQCPTAIPHFCSPPPTGMLLDPRSAGRVSLLHHRTGAPHRHLWWAVRYPRVCHPHKV